MSANAYLDLALDRFMRYDALLVRVRRLMKAWPCAESAPGEDSQPCWVAHRNGNGRWINAEIAAPLPPGAIVLRGSRIQEIGGDRQWGAALCLKDVGGYCPACRARERLMIRKRLWAPKRAAALRSLRAKYAAAMRSNR